MIRLEFAAELKRALGEDSLCFSVDTKNGRVAVKGWKDSVDLTPEEAITMAGGLLRRVPLHACGHRGHDAGLSARCCSHSARHHRKALIVAGGIQSRAEVDALDAMGVDAVAGMAVYSGAMEA